MPLSRRLATPGSPAYLLLAAALSLISGMMFRQTDLTDFAEYRAAGSSSRRAPATPCPPERSIDRSEHLFRPIVEVAKVCLDQLEQAQARAAELPPFLRAAAAGELLDEMFGRLADGDQIATGGGQARVEEVDCRLVVVVTDSQADFFRQPPVLRQQTADHGVIGGQYLLFDRRKAQHAIGIGPLQRLPVGRKLGMCRTNFGSKLNAAALCLRRQEPTDPQPWLRLFGCDVQFGSLEDNLLLDRATVDAPLPSANVPLANTFDRILTEQLAHFFDDDIVSRCKAYLLRQLTSGVPSAQETSTALGMSQRTLQRKLHELGLTYQNLCDETRHELARRNLPCPVSRGSDPLGC